MSILRYTRYMENEKTSQYRVQPPLFVIEQGIGRLELFPAVWSAAEDLLSEDLRAREDGLRRLMELDAARFSPLIGYLLVTRLTEPDTSVRVGIVRALSEALSADSDGQPPPEESHSILCRYLAQMRTRQVYALLQVLDYDMTTNMHVDRLLNLCPYAGNHLVEILNDRKVPISLRVHAIEAIGRVGFLDTLPALERLEARLESRQNGQVTMAFAPAAGTKEIEFLPLIKKALACLRAP